jgi:hypothetical protein
MNRSYLFSIIIAIIAILLVASFSDSAEKVKIIAKYDQFIIYENGIVYDEKTKFEWLAGPDKDTTWNEAKNWVESLTTFAGGGWRMPTIVELNRSLYKKGGQETYDMLRYVFKTSGSFAWSGETKGPSRAWAIWFYHDKYHRDREDSDSVRAFAVRSRR